MTPDYATYYPTDNDTFERVDKKDATPFALQTEDNDVYLKTSSHPTEEPQR
jgi:hypothetical protein